MVRIFLDVDGVINAVPADHSRLMHLWGDIKDFKVKMPTFKYPLQITFAQGVIDFLNQLIEEGHEVLWLTTWEERANTWICPNVGLKKLKLAGEYNLCFNNKLWWKHEIVKNLWENDPVPFVWLDDDLGATLLDGGDSALEWAKNLAEHCLAVAPDTRVGLTPANLDQISEFIKTKE